MHAWLQPMQARMSSRRPSAALAGSSGSQMSARVMIVMSQAPAASAFSASCGWLKRAARKIGTLTVARTRAACGRMYPVAIGDGGTMWSEPSSDADVPIITLT